MTELVVQSRGSPILMYSDVEKIRSRNNYIIPQDFKVGDVRKIQGKKWHKYFKNKIGDYRRIIRVRDIKRRWQTDILTMPLKDEEDRTIQPRRYAIDLEKLPKRKRDKKIITIWSLKGLLVDKDDRWPD